MLRHGRTFVYMSIIIHSFFPKIIHKYVFKIYLTAFAQGKKIPKKFQHASFVNVADLA